jgi:signal transduction histidine kinase
MATKSILVVDDDANLRRTLADILRVKGYDPIGTGTGKAALDSIRAKSPAVALIDLRLEDMPGLKVLRQIRRGSPSTECIVLTGYASQSSAIEAVNLGAYSYVQKPYDVEQLLVTVRRAIEKREAKEERERLLARIQTQVRQIREVLDTVPEGVVLLDAGAKIVLTNPSAQRDLETLAGAGVGDVLTHLGGSPLSVLLTWPKDKSWHEMRADGHTFEIMARPVSIVPDGWAGSPQWPVEGACPVKDVKVACPEPVEGWVLAIRDMTREREMQRRIRQQDRMAVVGQLAGGIAHDFNNILTTISGFTCFALEELAPGDPLRADLEEVRDAADRAAALTKRLLIFSRQEVLQPQVLNLNTVILDMTNMLQRLIGENLELNTTLDPSLGGMEADPGQVEQIVMNLVVNARDAMPLGGKLALETANVVLSRAQIRTYPEVRPGAYVMLLVNDSGIGMDKEIQSHLFEPFFTTKEKGKGTGLGLSTVYGIVKQSGGHIEVTSQVNVGTTFRIYFPRVKEEKEQDERQQRSDDLASGTETVLIAEDEDVVRTFARRVLEKQGYAVLDAGLPSEALDLGQQHAGPISLLITDVIMPGMGGRELAELLVLPYPEIKVLYISGYTDDELSYRGVLEPGMAYLGKPFTATDLARRVREVLDQSSQR